jgi:hypothetical protein
MKSFEIAGLFSRRSSGARQPSRALALGLVCTFAVLLAACGGGSSSTQANTKESSGSSSTGGNTTLAISGTPATTATVGSAYSFTPTTSGAAAGATLTFSIQNLPAWASFSTTTGALTGTPSGAGTASDIVISVSDGTSKASLAAFNIIVSATSGSTPTPACSSAVGSLTLNANITRTTGISPLLVFVDATSSTDTALTNTTSFQDVTYTWDFGDAGASGSGTWAYGSNPGKNSKNTATGAVAAHLYVVPDGTGDTTYTATVTATDGTNTATCKLALTAYDPAGANGFANTATTCVYNSTPGTGCPAGAGTLATSSFNTALGSAYMGNGKRVLFKCGDSFTGNYAGLGATKWSVGAYGSCQGTQSGRPILTNTGSSGIFNVTATDGRIADLDLEGDGGSNETSVMVQSSSQIALYNLYSNGATKSYQSALTTQLGLIQTVMTGLGAGAEGTYVNFIGNRCVNGSTAYNCGGTPDYVNIDYQAIIGGSYNGASNPSGYETVRLSACRLCIIENNLIENAGGNSYAVLKLHSGNPGSQATWIGQYGELIEISDNLFAGHSGAFFVEVAPQNSSVDERLRNIVLERNVFAGSAKGDAVVISGLNITARDNAVSGLSGGSNPILFFRRGIEWNYTAPTNPNEPEYMEAFNNTCYEVSTCIDLGSSSYSFAENNLAYNPSGGSGAVVSGGGSTSTVSNNSASTSADPGFTDGSGTYQVISDFTPTANYTGGTAVPVFYDALGVLWAPTWDLGAVAVGH